jgi:hypothetical protein
MIVKEQPYLVYIARIIVELDFLADIASGRCNAAP